MPAVDAHMSRNLLTIELNARLGEAAKRMVERGVGAVLILEGERLVGILTERDVLKAVAAGYDERAGASEWMTRHPETTNPATPPTTPPRS